MKDSKNLMDLKKQTVSSGKANSSAASNLEGGFKMYHLLIAAVVGLMLGAYIQLRFFKAQPLISQI